MCTPKNFATSKRSSEVPEILSMSSKFFLFFLCSFRVEGQVRVIRPVAKAYQVVFMLST